jgi:hypothetical protein
VKLELDFHTFLSRVLLIRNFWNFGGTHFFLIWVITPFSKLNFFLLAAPATSEMKLELEFHTFPSRVLLIRKNFVFEKMEQLN